MHVATGLNDVSRTRTNVKRMGPTQLAVQHSETAQRHGAKHLFNFGVISDVQHADIPDGASFHGVPRYYRNAKVALARAVGAWKFANTLDFAVHFGDILDGYQPKDQAEQVLDGLLEEFDKLEKPVYHMLGNHCLYNLPRPHLNQRLGIHGPEGGGSYYAFEPHPRWRVVVVDAYDVSVLGWPESHPLHQLAVQLLAQHNPNKNKNTPPPRSSGTGQRWVQFGGGASSAQLQWLEQQVQDAKGRAQKVMVFSHLPFMPGTCPNTCLQWRYQECLDIMRAAGNVVLTIAGHTHQNGYLQDEAGIHHVVLPAVLETPPGRDCYGHVEVTDKTLFLHGVDTMMSLKLPY
ncbi:Metallo-dependent phosphatase [Haematococcus lacustris]